MIPITQTILYNSENPEIKGNCFQACIASILEKKLEEVPHFVQLYENPIDFERELQKWLMNIGFYIVNYDTYVRLESTELFENDIYYMVSGRSSRGIRHCCIGLNTEIIFDPHPSRDGLVSIDGYRFIFSIPELVKRRANELL